MTEPASRTVQTNSSEAPPDIVVLRAKAHGLGSEALVRALRDRLPDHAIRWARTPQDERQYAAGAPVMVGQTISKALLARAEHLQLFACASAGTGRLPMDALAARGIAVTNASGVHVPNAAEHVIGAMLVFARRFHTAWRRQQQREWRHFAAFGQLAGCTATVLGLGPIGRSIVARLKAFEVKTVGVRYTPSKGGPTDEVIGFEAEPLHHALARTDYLIIACPLSETTRGLIGASELRTLPTRAVLVNVARGPIVDTDALVEALQQRSIHGAALDVTDPEPLPEDHPLWRLGNVLLTPHNAGYTKRYWTRLADLLARNLQRVEATGAYADLENQVLPAPSRRS
ncbi:MAG: D-2-hydroxyacid dehydrogenase [Bacteroidetes bacterium]|nr:D-2-hydroxyacid dehydrogenase [Bacteroidota bacterium]